MPAAVGSSYRLTSPGEEVTAMPKSLVVCCDGTWNTPDQRSPTNVSKIALSVADVDDNGCEQRTFYHLGVGTNRRERIRGGAFGYGLSRDVRDTYRFLVLNFEPGDRLFFFGFSRGAFTARSTAGFVRNCGILRRSEADRINEAYALYRNNNSTTHPRGIEATLFRRSYSHEPRIHFIGVWDTVGALGIPVDGLHLIGLLNQRWQFHDTKLSTSVDAAYQALAIDEQRGPFRPALWTQQPDAPPGQIVEQVWFSGVHCDVGGGNPGHGLSDIPLLWMVERAQRSGLRFDPDAFTRCPPQRRMPSTVEETVRSRTCVAPDPCGRYDDSRKGLYRAIAPYHRRLGVTDVEHEYVASSAVTRYEEIAAYAPTGLVDYLNSEDHHVMEVDHDRPNLRVPMRHGQA
jgi:uncharacterized protein (DUF2235 family)